MILVECSRHVFCVSVNFGGLVLQALLEHWPRTHTEDNPENGETNGTVDINEKKGNPYFSVLGHTPVIFR